MTDPVRWLGLWLAAGPLVWCGALPTFGLAKNTLTWAAAGTALLALAAARPAASRAWPWRIRLVVLGFAAALPAFALRTTDVPAGLDRLALDAAVVVFLAAVLRQRDDRTFERLADWAVLGGAAAAALDFASGLAGPALADRPPLGNAMIAGMHAAVLAPLALARAIACAREGETGRAAWRYAACVVLLLDLGATLSVGGIAAGAIGLATAWVVSGGRTAPRAVLAAAVAAATFAALWALPATRAEVEDHAARRAYGWTVSAKAARAAPLLGHGPGDHARAFYDAQGEHLDRHPKDAAKWTAQHRAHNTFLGRLVEDGPLPPLLVAAGLLGATILALRRRLATAGALVALALTTLYAFPLTHAPTAVLAALLLAGSGATPVPRRPTWATRAAPRAATAMVLVVAAAAFLGWAAQRATAEGLRAAGKTEAALALSPWDGGCWFAEAQRARGEGRWAAAAAGFAQAAELRARLVSVLMAGNAAAQTGDLDEAKRWFRQTLRWHPTNSLAYHNLAWLAALQGDLFEARRLAAEAIRLNPDHPQMNDLRELLLEDPPPPSRPWPAP